MGCTGSKAAATAEAGSQAERRQRALGAASSKPGPRPGAAANGVQPQWPAGGGSSAAPSPGPYLPSPGSSDSDSDAGSDWDQFSWRRHTGQGASVATSTGMLSPRDTVGSVTLSVGSVTSQLRLRQDSLFGISLTPRLEPVKDSGRLRLCKVAGVTFVNQYMVVKYLGRGSSGRVFLCMSIDDRRLYAVKIVKKGQAASHKAARSGAAHPRGSRRDPLEDLRREIAVMRRALHPNIVALREVVDDSTTNKMLLVMDYLEGGPVMTREGLERGHRVPEDVARLYFRDMCRALDYLHCRQRVVHGDLKPENALMGASGRIALSDFGCSKVMAGEGEDEGLFDRCNGTPAFLAPEMMKPHARYRGRPADVYALGGCLYSFVFGRIPFKADTVLELFEVVQSRPVAFPPDVPASNALKDLLLRMLAKDPAERLSLPLVMTHPWVTAGGSLRPLQPSISGQQAAGGVAAKRELAPAFDGASGAVGSGGAEGADAASDVAAADGPAASGPRQQPLTASQQSLAALQQQQGQQHGQPQGQAPPSWDQQAAEAEGVDPEQEALLRASLEGLLTGELQVQTFAAGEPLMRRGQPGAHLMYILEGECEVVYRTAPAPEAAALSPGQPNCQAGPIGSPAPVEGAGSGLPQHAQNLQQAQQQAQQAQRQAALDRSRPPPVPPQVSRRRSAAGLFSASADGGGSGAVAAAHGPGDSVQSGMAAAGAAALATADTLPSGSLHTAGGAAAAGKARQLFTRKTSSFISEAAEAAAAEDAVAAGAAQAPPPPQQQQHARQPQLRVSLPGSDAGLLSAEPSAVSETAMDSPRRPHPQPGSVAPTPASASSSLASTPWPAGHQRQHLSVDLEEAAAHLQSPAGPLIQPEENGEVDSGRPAGWQRSGSATQLAQGAAGAESFVDGRAAAVPPAQQQEQEQQWHPPRQGAPPLPPSQLHQQQPEVVGEELPPTLLEAATRAQELLTGLRRGGPRDFLAAVRGPGDFIGEMEVLGGSQSRRVATVVAASPSVRAAVIPYPVAKAYLARHPLAKQQLAQLMWLRQSEDLVLEALARLALLGEDLLCMLRT